MEDRYLKEQLDGVAESLYPPSMQAFGKVLRTCKLEKIRQMLNGYGLCKATALAQNVANSLEYDVDAISVLQNLGKILFYDFSGEVLERRLRDAILQTQPTILEIIIKVSCSNEKSFQKYGPAVLAMISHPLPRSIVLPISVKHFLTLLTNSLSRTQSVSDLRGLYTIFKAHPDTIPLLLHSSYQRTVHTVLAKCLVHSDQIIRFLTIACLAMIAQHGSIEDSQDHPQSLFEGVKGAKVVKLAISSVICALSTPSDENAEIVKLCSVAIDAVDARLIVEWVEQKGSNQSSLKLRERAEASQRGNMLSAYFEFLFILSGKLPDVDFGITTILRKTIEDVLFGSESWPDDSEQNVATAIRTMSTPTLYPFYLEILEKLYRGISHIRDPTQILHGLTELAESSSEFTSVLSSKFAENEFSSIVQIFLANSPDINLHDLKCRLGQNTCPRHSARQQILKEISLCEFTIKLGFLRNSLLEHSILFLALNKLTHLSSFTRLLDCTPFTRKPQALAILEEQATPFPHRESQTWRESLASELLRDAHSKYDNIVNTIGFVCRDLEQRCLTVETPLRKAEEEISRLKEHVEMITRERSQLEESCAAWSKDVEEMKLQSEGLTHELRCARAEVEGCQGELRNATADKERIELELDEEKRKWMDREEELLMTNQVLDEELKETQAKLEELTSKLNINGKERRTLMEEVNELQAKSTALEAELRKELTALERAQSAKDIEIASARNTQQELEQKISQLKDEIVSIEATSRKTLEQAVEEADLKILSIREECDQRVSAIQTKWEVAELNHIKLNEQNDSDKRRLTRQIQRLKRVNEGQRQEMLRMVEAHDRLQRAAAEMNSLRFSTTRDLLNNSDVDILSQQLSQIPANLYGGRSNIVSSPVSHRSKRCRVGDTPLTRRVPRTPLTALKSKVNIVPVTSKQSVQSSGSVTQDEEDLDKLSPLKKVVAISGEYEDLIPDEEGFSQFDI